ncbi:integrase family protein [Paucibacter sp. DJ1R-11]|uniref:tyrosine-type recombinase/integrase n=1 Tax=Paucibacter sp. DJ1R-11 TaxID=2893556 RepID=UPI0021E3D256|nr:integrase family protein [Paucibacter sp. DJ1R-11]MCV2365852.1 integrase family protein [Paucibacter sp. DJ1R-11]
MAKVSFTVGRVNGFKCPGDKKQAFLWDSNVLGLGVRSTPAGKPAYVFQSTYQGKDLRLTIGGLDAWSIPEAQAKARELQRMIDEGKDPRDLKRNAIAATQARKVAEAAQVEAEKLASVTVGEAWAVYLEDRKPFWGERNFADHVKMSKAGGEVSKRGVKLAPDGSKPKTQPGPIFQLMSLQIRELTPAVLEAWAGEHAAVRATYARLCWRCMKVFLNWCAEHPEYSRLLVNANPAKTKKAREVLGKPAAKDDALLREQLPAWFSAVGQVQNPVISAYLRVLLMTGARPGEVLTLKWEDVNTQWKSLAIRDKVEGERLIPLTPYVAHLLAGLPRRNEWVFASTRALSLDPESIRRRQAKHSRKGSTAPTGALVQASATGHLTDPSSAHRCAAAGAGLEGLTLHGLRRSFSSLTEWLDIPSGVVAQIQGHKPSATAEKHYKRRPLDLLRVHHERIEAWILDQAGVAFEAAVSSQARPKLSAVS